jgi:O-antigen/teichoic acid export membrane protein
LGSDNFGLFAVVGGIISFIAILNTIMLSTSNRFIATAIGKNIPSFITKTFNVNLIIHISIAILTIVILGPLGKLYIEHYINYDGSISNVLMIYYISLICSALSFIGVPYNGLLLAKERFIVFCSTDIIGAFLRMIISYMLINHFEAKLLIYALTLGITTAFPTAIFYSYCKRIFPQYVKFELVKDKYLYKEIFDFSIWVGYGALATIGKTQGGALIINRFFNTLMNTAYGIANTVNGILMTFAHNVTKSIAPQITKSYASGNYAKSENLVIFSSKLSFYLMLLVSSPFIVAPEFIFKLWLGEVPNYVIIFTYLIIADTLIGSLNAGIPEMIFASGKIRVYQIVVNTIFLLSVVAGYGVLSYGFAAYYLQIVYIIFSIIALIVRQVILNLVVKFNNRKLLLESYLPSLIITLLFLVVLLLKNLIHPIPLIICSLIYAISLVLIFGLTKSEREYILNYIKKLK